MPFALRGREGADIGEPRRCAVRSRLRFGMPSAQYRRPHRRENRPSLEHNTPVHALVASDHPYAVAPFAKALRAIFDELFAGARRDWLP
jgi:hypothetical protein